MMYNVGVVSYLHGNAGFLDSRDANQLQYSYNYLCAGIEPVKLRDVQTN
jgi:hypothetical protein